MRLFVCCYLLLSIFWGSVANASVFQTSGICDGYPKIDADLSSGYCLGLVFQGSPLVKPRQIIQWDEQHLLISDMGGWISGKGKLWLLNISDGQVTLLLSKLNLPHGLLHFSDNQIILGERDRITRITFDDQFQTVAREIVITRADFASHRHPLASIKLDRQKNLIVNFGAPSDQCLNDIESNSCSAREQHAQVRLYPFQKNSQSWSANYSILAKGLRNSMAIAVHNSGTIMQADNGMDFDRVHLPFETLNEFKPGSDFGWPYCHSMQDSNSAWKSSAICAGYSKPTALLPPHAAPLDMLYYQSDKLPSLNNKLIIPFHGYQKAGHRIVAVSINDKGIPLTAKHSNYHYFDKSGMQQQASFPDNAGARLDYILDGWQENPKGAISGIMQAKDGSIFLVDDNNHAIMRLSTSTQSQ